VLSVLWFMAAVDPFDLWLLLTPLIHGCYRPLWFMAADTFDLWLLLTPLIYGCCWPFWFIVAVDPFDLWLLLTPLIYGCCWPFDLWLLLTPLIYGCCWPLWCIAAVDPLIYGCCWPLWFMAAVDPFGSFKHYFSCIQILFCLKDGNDFDPSRSSILTIMKKNNIGDKQKIYHTMRRVPTSNWKILEMKSRHTPIPNCHTHECFGLVQKLQ
jgi:hypothetical protein